MFWEHPNSTFGDLQRGVLGISRHVFWEHPDMCFGGYADIRFANFQTVVLGHSESGFGVIQTWILETSRQ
jgi:hypothetical protein